MHISGLRSTCPWLHTPVAGKGTCQTRVLGSHSQRTLHTIKSLKASVRSSTVTGHITVVKVWDSHQKTAIREASPNVRLVVPAFHTTDQGY